ncbi:MAG: TlpA disulfide reductase family protein [Chitinophagaceae bacterium]
MKRYLSLLPGLLFFFVAYSKPTIITGKIAHPLNDTVKLIITLNDITRQRETITTTLQQGQFAQPITIATTVYLFLTDGTNYINMLVQPGDSIHLEYDAGQPAVSTVFSGRGKEQCIFLRDLALLKMQDRMKEQVILARQTNYPFDYLFNYIDSTERTSLKQLYQLQNVVHRETFQLLYAHVKSHFLSYKYRSAGTVYHESIATTVKNRQSQLTPATIATFKSLLQFDSSCASSSFYINTVYTILFMDYDAAVLEQRMSNDLTVKYTYLNSLLPGSLKIPVLTLFLDYDISKLNQAEKLEQLINTTYHPPTDSVYRNYIAQRFEDGTKFSKGMKAPDFVVENEKGEKVSLATLRGKVVFIDFWYAACGPCLAGFQNLHALKQRFANKEVVFLNISIDNRDTWLKALQKLDIAGYHVFTENKGNQHPIISSYKVNSYPTTCLLDRQGNIFMANPSRDPQELESQLEEALKAVKP